MKSSLSLGIRAVVAVAAVEIASGGGGGGGPAPTGPQFVLRPVGTSSNVGTFTITVDRDSIDANNADTVRVVARLFSPSQRPIAGAGVIFQASFPDVSFVDGTPIDLGNGLPAAE